MNYKLLNFFIFAIIISTNAVKVNLHGSLSFGKDVMDTFSYYIRRGNNINLVPYMRSGRRSQSSEFDPIALQVKTASLCKNLEFCKGDLEKFLVEYVTTLAQSVKRNFDGILQETNLGNVQLGFFEKLKVFLNEVRKILKVANEKLTEDREAHLWVDSIKKISSKFQTKSITTFVDRLDADTKDLTEIKKKLTQSLVVEIVMAEVKAQKRLCYEFHICSRSNECTTALNVILSRMKKFTRSKVKEFMAGFYDAISETAFYSILDPVTANEFKVILSTMAYTDTVPSLEILNSVQETVEARLNTMYTSAELKNGQDAQLVHVILSDLDFLFSKHKSDPFSASLDGFLTWAKAGGKILPDLRDILYKLKDFVTNAPEEIMVKIIHEVKVFLEITVDPDT